MANSLTKSSKPSITLEGATKLRDSVNESLKVISEGYLAVTPLVAKMYNVNAYKPLGYKNFDEMCMNEFGMSHGTTVGIRKVFKLYGDTDSNGNYIIPEEYKSFGYTKLLLFASDSEKFKQIGIDPIKEFTPDMTIKEMKSALALKLEEKAGKQEAEAIDTTATDSDSDSTESIIDNGDSTEIAEDMLATPLEERLNALEEILDCVKMLHDLCDYTIQAEKLALLDALAANVKDFEKEVKKAYK